MNWNWNKTRITLPYSSENLKALLNAIYMKENTFFQVDFCMWCDNLTMDCDEKDLNDHDQLAFRIARDIEAQWDMQWGELYSHEKLKKIDPSKLELPPDWFKEWKATLNGK